VSDGRQSVLVHANLLGLEEEEIGVYEYVYEQVRNVRDKREYTCRPSYGGPLKKGSRKNGDWLRAKWAEFSEEIMNPARCLSPFLRCTQPYDNAAEKGDRHRASALSDRCSVSCGTEPVPFFSHPLFTLQKRGLRRFLQFQADENLGLGIR
jgi:hypothetical protein